MDIKKSVDALRPYTSQVPSESLSHIRTHWDEAKPLLLAEFAKGLDDPMVESDALFVYAMHLLAEMRAPEVFPLLIGIARQPRLILEHLLGDILTESFPQMLARTCDERINDLKALVEDSGVDEFARAAALDALMILCGEGEIPRPEISNYCVTLFRDRLEYRASFIWDAVIALACVIQAPGTLPFIQAAYQQGLADPQVASLDWVVSKYEETDVNWQARVQHERAPFESTEQAMSFFVSNWGDGEFKRADDGPNLVEILDERRNKPQSRHTPGSGRNKPCPCGSGKKFKKCCLNRPVAPPVPKSVLGNPVAKDHACANDWMEAGYHLKLVDPWKANECWKQCWRKLQTLLPATLIDPSEAEEAGAFEGFEFLINWIQDFGELLVSRSRHRLDEATYAVAYFGSIFERFPGMAVDTKQNMQVNQAHCLARLGQLGTAMDILEEMILNRPESAQGYVELAVIYSFDAGQFNVQLDIPKAIRYLEDALKKATDHEEYDVEEQLDGLKRWRRDMERRLIT